MNFFLFILKGVFLPSSEKTTVHKITHLLFCPPSSSKKRKLLLGASAGFAAEESSDSTSYAILSRLVLSDVVRSAKWVPAGSASYANGLAFCMPAVSDSYQTARHVPHLRTGSQDNTAVVLANVF